jgi:hypothetical protein
VTDKTEKVSNIQEPVTRQPVCSLLVGDLFSIPQQPSLFFKLVAKSNEGAIVVQALTGSMAGEYTNALPNFIVQKETVH